MQQPRWMVEAWTHLSETEIAGKRHNPEIVAFYRDAGRADIKRDEVPWCAAFVGACLSRAGRTHTGSLLARSYLQYGEVLDRGRFGAIAVLTRGHDPGAGHVGFWVGETDDAVILLGGNQSDAVTVARFEKKRLLGYRWPGSLQQADAARSPDARVFEAALAHVLEMEGGYSDDPHDPGGPTNQGITLATYARFVGRALGQATRADLVRQLKAIAPDAVRTIYATRYWRPSQAARLPPAVALMHFDASVNHGVGGAARMLQQVLGVTVDGEIGPLTLAAARAGAPLALIERYAEVRRMRYRGLDHFWRFGRGWLRRVDRTLARARALVAEADATPSPDPKHSPNEKGGTMTELATAPDGAKWWGSSMTIWGALITAASTVVPVLGPAIGINVTPELVVHAGEQVVSIVQAIGGLVGTAMTIYGRARAQESLARREVRVSL